MNIARQCFALLTGLTLATTAAHAVPTVEMTTTLGKIVIELNAEKAPKSTANFLQYAKDGFFNGTIFHRVMPGFMIQGGGFDEKMNQKATRAPIENEATNGLKNKRGSLAMARTNNPHSATAQFFINHGDNSDRLSPQMTDGWGYAVFGQVKDGMDVVDKIAKVPTGSVGPHSNVPQTPVIIQSVKIISEK